MPKDQKQKILVIDSDQFIVRTLMNKFWDAETEIIATDQSWIALQMLEDGKFDLILLELVLPLFGGYTILENLQSSSLNKNTPVIILTNLCQTEDLNRLFEFEIQDYILKQSLDFNELMQKMREILAHSRKLSSEEKEELKVRTNAFSLQHATKETLKVNVLKCSKCEATLSPKTEFCPYCGTKIDLNRILQQNYS